jgi:hypothetical protein
MLFLTIPVALAQTPPPPSDTTTVSTDTPPPVLEEVPTTSSELPPPSEATAPPSSGISQYVEELPTAGGTSSLEARPKKPPKLPPRVQRAIRKAGADAPTLRRLVTSPPPTPPPSSQPTGGPAPRPQTPRPKPNIQREQRELVHQPDRPPVSSEGVSSALNSATGGADTHVLALLVGLGLVTAAVAALAVRRRRSAHGHPL